jgi:hypothetical protein
VGGLSERALSERDCRRYAMQVVAADVALLVEAGGRSGPLSFEDWLCFLTCRDQSWT